MTIELELEDESEDISPEAVKNFLEKEAAKDTVSEEQQPSEIKPEHKDMNTVSYTLQSDTTFSEPQAVEKLQQIAVKVNERDIPVTEADQRMYLKSVLNDVPVEITIPVMNNMMKVTCRALSVAESEKIIVAAIKYFKDNPELNSMLMPDYIRQLRTICQVVRINGKPAFPAIDINSETFVSEVWTAFRDMSTARYNAISAALNVFEHKLSRLNAAALNEDFWLPGEID